ncbi:MAG TPA: c-type cytochrome [Methylobacterium sp.]|uniref:c-type cytochrome n=1 Tax=Methylorubrum sp. B1-46 TaxID=2897334 RepID=UPI001E3A83F1|nr:c-type cytochrome [Methylorubrum sp. B1-46]UGB26032.1 c-type cytochrome [Methylorubrum sp. B1-46]HEV2542881.1 c-type cytochrome [Methylobacterium sp.]
MKRTFHLPLFRRHALLIALAFLVTACSDESGERRRSLGDNPRFGDFMRVADAGRGSRLFGQCAACHTVRVGAGDRNGPSLHDVVGKPVASNSRRFGYTGALRSTGGVWTPERLDAWLAAPAQFAPGTSMSFRGVPDPLDRADIVAYLQAQSVGAGGVEALSARP